MSMATSDVHLKTADSEIFSQRLPNRLAVQRLPKTLIVEEAAELSGYSEEQLRRLIHEKQITAEKR